MADSHHADAALARELADAAGAHLLELRRSGLEGADLRKEGDRTSHTLLMERLADARPGDAVLSEEGADGAARLSAERVWIIDPLDGTREYGETERSDWAVHVALWQRGHLAAGAVALPARGTTFGTDRPAAILSPRHGSHRLRLAVSRTRPPSFVVALADQLGAELVPMGSAGVKATAVLTDEVDAYVHAGGQYEWDSAAPVAVCAAAGLHTSRIDGSALQYNQPDPLLPDVLICRPEVTSTILPAIHEVLQEAPSR
ncbi:MAG TPA: 3'(2'),5'-bisphosphate nucleotidase CysQ [Actinomycetales bacterium]|nr:3'(2'),5'-bisphosphate nucleotidase CysQ [Actinomycetales bacterium]